MSNIENVYISNKDINLLINKLKSEKKINQELINNFYKIAEYQNEIIKNIEHIADKYEGKDSSIGKLEKTLEEFRKQHKIAKILQSSIFPTQLPDNNLLSIKASLYSMDETSGGFYDIVEIIPNSVYGILLADISGHGVSAALITNLAKMLFVRATQKYASPKDVMTYVNTEICNILHQRSYFTACYILLDFPNKQFIYSSAGHPYNLRYNTKTKQLEKISTRNMVIGVKAGREFTEQEIDFNVGDRIILYTDGISEARNENKEMFGDERLKNVLLDHIEAPADILMETIENEVKKFTGRDDFDDDVTMITIDIKSDADKDESAGSQKGYYTKEETNRLIDYYKKSIKIKEKHNDQKGMANDLIRIGQNLIDKGEYDEGFKHISDAEKIAQKLEDTEIKGEVNIALGYANTNISKFDKALNYYSKALKLFEKTDNKRGLSRAYNNMSIIHSKKGENSISRKYLFQVLEVEKQRELSNEVKRNMAIAYNNLGVSYHNESDPEKALEYYHKSLDLAEKYDILSLQGTLMNNLGTIYTGNNDIETALKYFHKGLHIVDEINNKDLLSTILLNIAEINSYRDEAELTFYYLKKALSVCYKYNLTYKESIVRTQRAYEYLKINNPIESIEDIRDALSIIKQIKADPTSKFIYISIAMLLYRLGIDENTKSEEIKNKINDDSIYKNYKYIINSIDNKQNPDEIFKDIIEKCNTPRNIGTYIPANYEYAKYLYEIKAETKAKDEKEAQKIKEEAVSRLREAYKTCIKYKDYHEKGNTKKIAEQLGLKPDIFNDLD